MMGCRHLLKSFRGNGRLLLLMAFLLVLLGVGIGWGSDYYRAIYHLRAARIALEERRFEQAEQYLDRHLRLCPDSAEGHFLLARLARRRDCLQKAEKHLKTSRSLGWSLEAIHLESVLHGVQQGEFVGSVESYLHRRLANRDPESFLIYEALSQGYTRTYRLPQALDSLNHMLEEEPNNAYALLRRGWVLERLNRPDDALKDYRQAVDSHPRHELARQRLAEHLLAHLNIEQAVQHFEVLHTWRPDDCTIGANLAHCWAEVGRREEARELLDYLLADHPDASPLLLERGRMALSDGQWDRAEEWLRHAVHQQPHSLGANYALYLCLNHRGTSEEAERILTHFKSLEANGKQLEQLMLQVGRSNDAALRCTIAQLFFRLGEDREGERWLVLALQSDPTYQPAQGALAAYYNRTGATAQTKLSRPSSPADVRDCIGFLPSTP